MGGRTRVVSGRWHAYLPGIRQRIVLKGPVVTLALYRLDPGTHSPLHRHQEAQMGICIEGSGLHRVLLWVRHGRSTRGEMTEIRVQAGDAYYIPPLTPHEFIADPKEGATVADLVTYRVYGNPPL